MTGDRISLAEIALRKGGSVDPKKHPDEEFELYSIPAFDAGTPDIVTGSAIGSSKKAVQPNDVMVSRIVPHIRRACVVGPTRGLRQIASSEWIIFRDERIWPQYLRWVLVGDVFHSAFMRTVSGVGGSLLRARPSEVFKIKIPLPPLPEQRRIAAFLDKADTVRRKRQQTLDLADDFLRSAFLDLFGDPVTNPKGWPVKKLGELCRVVRGSSPRPKGDPRYYDGPVPRLMVADITRDGWLVTPKIDSLTEAGARLSRPVPRGTVVMVVSGNVGVVAQLEIDACIHDGFVGFLDLDKPPIDPEYFLLALHFLKSTHERRKAGAIWQNLTTHDIKRIPVLMPPRELQEQSRQIMSGFRTLSDELDSALRAVDSLARSLTQRAFRGEL